MNSEHPKQSFSEETIVQKHKANFDTLIEAAKADRLCLVECEEAGDKVAVICAVNITPGPDGRSPTEFEMVPLARFFNGNPYDLLKPPKPGGGFHDLNPCGVWMYKGS